MIRKPPCAKAQTALRKQKIKYGKKRFSTWQMKLLHPECGMWLQDNMSLNSPGGSILQFDMKLWDDMP